MSITAGLVLNELHMYLPSLFLSVCVCMPVLAVFVHEPYKARNRSRAQIIETKNTRYKVYMIICVCVCFRQLRDDKWTDSRSS